jgi:uncharacterized pyridoxal phosphate-containing UPF0001 family protein
MTIPALDLSTAELATHFAAMAQLVQKLTAQYPSVDTLSMGMSDDLAVAIEHGSTCVRIGRGIFGARQPQGAL